MNEYQSSNENYSIPIQWTVPFYPQDPDASYDVNDRDSDPQPRYTQLNDNR